jgi:hypothetical protein
MTALEDATSLKSMQQDFISCKGWALRFTHFQGMLFIKDLHKLKASQRLTCDVKGWMPEDFMAEWLKESLGQMTKCFFLMK